MGTPEARQSARRTLTLRRRPAVARSGEPSPGISAIILVADGECQCQNFQRVMPIVADRKLDCIGLFCPMPILKTRDAVKQMAVGQILEMTSDDPASEADMPSWTARSGSAPVEIDTSGAV